MERSAQNPTTSSHEYNAEAWVINQRIKDVHTGTPCKVLAVFPLPPGDTVDEEGRIAGTVDVELQIDQKDNNGNRLQTRPVYNIPYERVQGGRCALVIDPVIGDIGSLKFCERDISNFKKTRERGIPPTQRMHSQSDAIYSPGILNDPPSIYIRVYGDGGVLIECAEKDCVVNCQNATVNAEELVEVNCECASVNAQETVEVTCVECKVHATTQITLDSVETVVTGHLTVENGITWRGRGEGIGAGGDLYLDGTSYATDHVSSSKAFTPHRHYCPDGITTEPI